MDESRLRVVRANLMRVLPVAAVATMIAAGCRDGTPTATKADAAPAKKASPATVVVEADLVKVVLTPEAEKRLGIATAKVEEKEVPRSLSLGGELVVPPGRSSVVAAPYLGTLLAPEGGSPPLPGQVVKKGQILLRLRPLLSPDRALLTPSERLNLESQRADAEGKLVAAKLQFEQAKTNLERTERLVEGRTLPTSALVDVKNAYDQAKSAFDAAGERLRVLKYVADGKEEEIKPVPLTALADGVLRGLPVQIGQRVTSGTVLFEVVTLDPLYVRAPVFVGDLDAIATDLPAMVGALAAPASAPRREAKPAAAPPSADPLASTADLHYEISNADGRLRPGERVGVSLRLKGASKGPVVPQAALLRDIDGGSWVYESLGGHAFARRRVVVDRVVDGLAVLNLGPKPGTPIVTDGSAELFGVEFGGSK